MSIILHTDITVRFRRIVFDVIFYGFFETVRQFVCNSTLNRNDVLTDIVQAVEYLLSILYRH
jgi:hypothetical protein